MRQLAQNLTAVDLHGAKIAQVEALKNFLLREREVYRVLSQVVDADPIYIMYTSGSTGTPKGVTIPHRGIIDYAKWVVDTFHFDETTVMANQAPFYFDNSTFDILWKSQVRWKAGFNSRCADAVSPSPPRVFGGEGDYVHFLGADCDDKRGKLWCAGACLASKAANGCVLRRGDANKQLNVWRRALPQCTYANLYGPTEITDVCCYYLVDRDFADSDPLPIGRACENMRVVLLTEDGREAAPGEQGELCVIGTGVALGYWNAPEITAKAFVQNPLSSDYAERMYRTGDLAYWDEDGLLQFCGRKDNQIKLKGNRIELGEIETAAMCIEGVENAAAIFDASASRLSYLWRQRERCPSAGSTWHSSNIFPSICSRQSWLPWSGCPIRPTTRSTGSPCARP